MSSTSKQKLEANPQQNFNDMLSVYLDNLYTLSEDKNLELEVRFGTRHINKVTKIDFNNVIQVLKGHGFDLIDKEQYLLRIQNEYLDSHTGQNKISGIRTEIVGLSNIQDYCKTNSLVNLLKTKNINFVQKNYFKKGEIIVYPVNFDDFNFRLSLQIEKNLSENSEHVQNILRGWNDNKKIFRFIKRFTLVHHLLPFNIDLSIVKTSHKNRNAYIPEYDVKASHVFEALETYELEIEIDNTKIDSESIYKSYVELASALRKTIKYVLCGLQQTSFPISYFEQQDIILDYLKLIKGDKFRDTFKATSKDFIGPSSFTLQMQNIISLDIVKESESDIPNIRKNYTVTDKADGERKLLFINKTGHIYLITTLLNIEFTGAITKEKDFFNTIIDGEHILYNKNRDYINLYAAFDIYYLMGKNVTALGFVPLSAEDKPIEYRLPILNSFIKKLKVESIVPKEKSPIRIDVKTFYAESQSQNIFQGCAIILENIKEKIFEYETDGLIFTPMDTAVGQKNKGMAAPPYKITWDASFKWKPPEFNTIDFLITINKNTAGLPITGNLFTSGVNLNKETQLVSYQTIVLRVGFDEKKHGYINPCENIINDKLPHVDEAISYDAYKPVQFYPTNPTDFNAGISNIVLRKDKMDNYKMFTEENEIIEDNTIVEFRYDLTKDQFWRWVPLRVRYDKTAEYRSGGKNYGNAYHVANSNWHSIHNPITKEIITTGEDIPYQLGDDDIYYNKITSNTKTRALRDFHNLYVKNILINNVSKRGNTLIDYAVGKGGDLPKWINAKLSFVLGIDIARDNIENRLDGACARYLNYHKKFRVVPRALFLQGNSNINIRNGDALYTEKGKQIINAVFGEGAKDEKFLGAGVYKVYGVAKDGFNISSCQFSLHYMFENALTLNNFLKNLSECTKVGGYFIGTSYDGEKVFNELKSKNIGEGVSIFKNDKKIWEMTKRYNQENFEDNASSLGYAIDIYQESINKTFREYLVNYTYLTQILENYGFVLLTPEEFKDINLPASIGTFNQLFYKMQTDIKRDKKLRNAFGSAPEMSDEERRISFLNKYFVFKKVANVDSEQIFGTLIKGDGEEGEDIAATFKAQKILSDIQEKLEEKSPSGKEKSPSGKEKTPSAKEKSPSGKEKSPSGKEKTPSAKEKSPSGKEKTPSGKEKSPTLTGKEVEKVEVEEKVEEVEKVSSGKKKTSSGKKKTFPPEEVKEEVVEEVRRVEEKKPSVKKTRTKKKLTIKD